MSSSRKYLFLITLVLVFIIIGNKQLFAAQQKVILSPGTVTTCGEIVTTGIYTLANNIGSGGKCIVISSVGTSTETIIDGAGFTINGNVNGDFNSAISFNGNNFTIENATVTGTVSSDGADFSICGTTAGNAGSIYLINSTTTLVTANGGSTQCPSENGGDGGFIKISGSNIDLSGTTLSVNGGKGSTNGIDGSVEIDYLTFDYSSYAFPALSSIALYGPGNFPGLIHLTDFIGGFLKLNSTSTTDCTNPLDVPGIYTLTGNVIGDCVVISDAVTIDGAGYTINGNIIANAIYDGGTGFNISVKNVTVTGSISSNGLTDTKIPKYGGGGVVSLSNVIAATTTANGSSYNNILNVGHAGNISISSSSIQSVLAMGSSGSVSVSSSSINLIQAIGDPGGVISVASSTVYRIYANGSSAKRGGSVTVTNSTTTIISADASDRNFTGFIVGCGIICGTNSGHAGTVHLTDSIFQSISASAPSGNGSVGGTVVVSGTSLNFASSSVYASGVVNGTVRFNYVDITIGQLWLSTLSDLFLNGSGGLPGDLGAFGGGYFVMPGIINNASECNLNVSSSTYVLGANITGDCHITADNVVLDGRGLYSVSGNIVGDANQDGYNGHSFTLKNLTVVGSVTSIGSNYFNSINNSYSGSGGSIIIDHSQIISDGTTTSVINASAPTSCEHLFSCGSGGNVTVTYSTTTNIVVNGGSQSYGNAHTGGSGGTVYIATSTTASVEANGGFAGVGGNGGNITVLNSFENTASSTLTANGGDAIYCGYGGSGGSIVISTSTYTGAISANKGLDVTANCGRWSPSGSSGSSGSVIISGIYNPLIAQPPTPPVTPPTPAPTPVPPPSSGGVSGSFISPIATTPVAPVTTSAPKPFFSGSFTEVASAAAQKVGEVTTTFVNSPASKTIQATGFFGGLVASVAFFAESSFATPIAASEVVLIPARLWGLVLMGLGIRRKSRPWGTVYDSVTKQPIDPAYITARDSTGRIVAEAVTDVDGRYGFLLPDGIYYITAKKTNYSFPSKKLDGRQADELYNDLYFGEPVTVKGGQVIDKNIPLDQVNFDWNEQNKSQTIASNAPTFHTRHERPVAIISNYAYAVGLIISVVAVAMKPTTFNVLVLISYTLILLFLKWSAKPKRLGSVMDQNHKPMPYAIIRVTTPDKMVTLRSAVADAEGRYYCIVPKGEYVIEIQKKNVDGSYTKVYETPARVGMTGLVNDSFVI